MTEDDVFHFLVSLVALLAMARLFGEGARKVGLPNVFGEICAGIVLGPTVLGHISPATEAWAFPSGPAKVMLNAYTTVSVILLLMLAGLEVDLGVVRRRGRSAFLTSVLGILCPLAGGLLLGFLLPDADLVHPERRTLFALFCGVALSISALPVIAKTLLDLGIYKTDIGLLVMSAAMIDDLVGWLCFSLLLGPMRGGESDVGSLLVTLGSIFVFVTFALIVVRRAIDAFFGQIDAEHPASPGQVLSLIVVLAILGAICALRIGVHAVFGGFVVGVAVGDSPRLREHTKAVIHEFVTNIFAPVFFASLALRADFARAFDLRLCLLTLGIATVAKVLGCSVGGRLGGLTWRESGAVAFGLNARGAMEIILALLALEAGLIQPKMFVALVMMALATSLMSGPFMKRLLSTDTEDEEVAALLERGAFVPSLAASSPSAAIKGLVDALASRLGASAERAHKCVVERERVAPTGIGDEVAVPHAAVDGLARPVLAIGLASDGIDFDAPDGRPAKIIILLLVPPGAYEREVRILASIARALLPEASRRELLAARSKTDAIAALSHAPPQSRPATEIQVPGA